MEITSVVTSLQKKLTSPGEKQGPLAEKFRQFMKQHDGVFIKGFAKGLGERLKQAFADWKEKNLLPNELSEESHPINQEIFSLQLALNFLPPSMETKVVNNPIISTVQESLKEENSLTNTNILPTISPKEITDAKDLLVTSEIPAQKDSDAKNFLVASEVPSQQAVDAKDLLVTSEVPAQKDSDAKNFLVASEIPAQQAVDAKDSLVASEILAQKNSDAKEVVAVNRDMPPVSDKNNADLDIDKLAFAPGQQHLTKFAASQDKILESNIASEMMPKPDLADKIEVLSVKSKNVAGTASVGDSNENSQFHVEIPIAQGETVANKIFTIRPANVVAPHFATTVSPHYETRGYFQVGNILQKAVIHIDHHRSPVLIYMEIQGGELSAKLHASGPATLHMLQQNVTELKNTLVSQGLQVNEIKVVMSETSQEFSGASQGFSESSRQHGFFSENGSGHQDFEIGEISEDMGIANRQLLWREQNGKVNYYV